MYSSNANIDAARKRLIEIIKYRSFQNGNKIKLSSGRSSQFYFDMKPTMLNPEGSYLIGLLILDLIKSDNAELIGGLEMGAVPLATAISVVSYLQNSPIPAFFVRKQAKEYGMQLELEGFSTGETIERKSVVIVEDVTTTGKSALRAINSVSNAGGKVAAVASIVDREEGAHETFLKAGVPFKHVLSLKDFN
ncbi:MAG: orotate phosphoribosyltransferase [Hyphomicrobiaceae bacterium]|nr:orotate phosphoribosyltransferase [Hyphomicrobiaceae bacterium]